jgi:hypothetical protein
MNHSWPSLVQAARHFQTYFNSGDARCVDLLTRLSERTGAPPQECAAKIAQLADASHPMDGFASVFKAAA